MPLPGTNFEAAKDPLRPARAMADVLKSELGLDIEPEAIVELFKKRWLSLSNLAHGIHTAITLSSDHCDNPKASS